MIRQLGVRVKPVPFLQLGACRRQFTTRQPLQYLCIPSLPEFNDGKITTATHKPLTVAMLDRATHRIEHLYSRVMQLKIRNRYQAKLQALKIHALKAKFTCQSRPLFDFMHRLLHIHIHDYTDGGPLPVLPPEKRQTSISIPENRTRIFVLHRGGWTSAVIALDAFAAEVLENPVHNDEPHGFRSSKSRDILLRTEHYIAEDVEKRGMESHYLLNVRVVLRDLIFEGAFHKGDSLVLHCSKVYFNHIRQTASIK